MRITTFLMNESTVWLRSIACIVISLLVVCAVNSCGDSSDEEKKVSITEANQYGSEFAIAQENAFDANLFLWNQYFEKI